MDSLVKYNTFSVVLKKQKSIGKEPIMLVCRPDRLPPKSSCGDLNFNFIKHARHQRCFKYLLMIFSNLMQICIMIIIYIIYGADMYTINKWMKIQEARKLFFTHFFYRINAVKRYLIMLKIHARLHSWSKFKTVKKSSDTLYSAYNINGFNLFGI